MAASIMKLTPDAGCSEHKMQLRRGDGYVVPERRFQCWTKEIAPVTFLPHGEGLRSPRSLRCYRPDVRPPEPADFSFGFAGCSRQLLRFKLLRFGARPGGTNLAAHRCSNLLSRWRGLLAMSRRRVDQVSDEQECAHANESCQADGEQKPDEFNLLGAEVEAAHRSPARTAFCSRQYSPTLRWGEGGQELGLGPVLDLSVARGFGPRGSIGPWGDP